MNDQIRNALEDVANASSGNVRAVATFRAVGDKRLRPFYSIDIEETGDGSRVAYFNSTIHMNKRTKIGPNYSPEFPHDEILRDVLPYAIRRFGSDIIYCPCCGV